MNLTKPVLWLVFLLALLFGLFIISGNSALRQLPQNRTTGNAIPGTSQEVRIPPPQPPAKASDLIAAQPSRGFQLLVSYMDSGFEPKDATVHQSDTVRFTNNSTRDLWIAADGSSGPVYPGVQNGCGSSALDSCRTLSPGEYWEFTFAKSGTWAFLNNLDKGDSGVVRVHVE